MNQRIEFVRRALRTENFRALCREYGISPRVGYKWRERLMEQGEAGMAERSRRPQRSPEALGEEVVCRIVRLKERHRHWGPRKLREIYLRQWGAGATPSESSFQAGAGTLRVGGEAAGALCGADRTGGERAQGERTQRGVDGGLQRVVARRAWAVRSADGA
jgi:hypothetical protein